MHWVCGGGCWSCWGWCGGGGTTGSRDAGGDGAAGGGIAGGGVGRPAAHAFSKLHCGGADSRAGEGAGASARPDGGAKAASEPGFCVIGSA